MDRDGRAQGYEDRRARLQPGRILIPDLVAERLRSLQERPELPGRGGHGSAPRNALPGAAGGGRLGAVLPSFLAGTDSLPVPLHVLAHERRTPLTIVHWPRGRGRVDEHGQEPSDRHVQRDREVSVGEVDPFALPYRAAEDRPQPLFRVWAGQGLGRHWDRWLPKDCAHSSSLLSVGCRAAGATSTPCGYSRPRRSARRRTLTEARR